MATVAGNRNLGIVRGDILDADAVAKAFGRPHGLPRSGRRESGGVYREAPDGE